MDAEHTDADGAYEASRSELRRAYLLVSFGRFEAAVEACRRADDLIDGGHHLPKTLEGSFLISKGDTAEALQVLRRVVADRPEVALPRIHFAEACFLEGRMRQGEHHLEEARRIDDGRHDALIERLAEAWLEVEVESIPPPMEVAI